MLFFASMRTSRVATSLALGVIVLVWASCGSKKDANKSNFKTAIQAELEKEPVCIGATLPHDVPSWNGRLKTNDQLEALVRAGLVKRTQTMVARSVMDAMLEDTRPKEVPGYRYEVADAAKKYVVHVRTHMGGLPELCYGKKKVDEIVRFTEPAPGVGATVSQVTYTWKLTDIAGWARNPDVEKYFYTDQFLSAADTPREAQTDLALSNDGWHVPNGF